MHVRTCISGLNSTTLDKNTKLLKLFMFKVFKNIYVMFIDFTTKTSFLTVRYERINENGHNLKAVYDIILGRIVMANLTV